MKLRRFFPILISVLCLWPLVPSPALAEPLCAPYLPFDKFPRPANDNGWGIHWGPGAANQDPAAIAFFTQEVQAMGLKWVKLLNRGTDFAMDGVVEALVQAGLMPLMRLYVPEMQALYPPDIERLVRHYRGRGVLYYQVYNEPNLLDEWPAGAGIDINHVANVWIPAAHAVQEAGGFPSTPPLAPGGHWEDMNFFRTFLREIRRRAQTGDQKAYQLLCGEPSRSLPALWVAVHNYGLNHYFDYPRDPINLEAALVTEAEKRRYGIRPETVNGLNEARLNSSRLFPVSDTLLEDSNGFYKFLAYAQIFAEEVGYVPAVHVTEGGWLMGDGQDPRYPVVNETFLLNETLRGYEYMLLEAPDFFLSWSPWILCNFACNGTDGRFEPHAWYKSRNADDSLAIVPALKNLDTSRSRLGGQSVIFPWWLGERQMAHSPSPLKRHAASLIKAAARRVGQGRYEMVGGTDALRILRDPLAIANRFLLNNITSRPVRAQVEAQFIDLKPYGEAVVEIRPRLSAPDIGPLNDIPISGERLRVLRVPGESEADFQARLSFDGLIYTSTAPLSAPLTALAQSLPASNPFAYGVRSVNRLSCAENGGKANLFVEVQDTQGQALDGIPLVFNTVDKQNPFQAFSGAKGPGQAEFALIAGPGRGGHWTIQIAEAAGGSPLVDGLRTDLPDDICPNKGNTFGHYSYRVLFQQGASRGFRFPREPLQIIPNTWLFPSPRPLPPPNTPAQARPYSAWPRPAFDNGLGLHFLPIQPDGFTLDLFIYHMLELDLRWATVYYNDENALRLAAEKFRAAGMMVIWRPAIRPYETYLHFNRDIAILREVGMPPYIQIYNEPIVGQEWDGHPIDLEVYYRHFIGAADAVYQAGGYVGFQNVGAEVLRTLLERVKAQGKDYLFSEAFFVPHCYGSNHPPAYPYDPLNQADTGSTIETDFNASVLCFLKHAQIWEQQIGFVPPMVMGEGGWATNILEDGRYPRVTGQLHRDYHLSLFNWFVSGQLSNGQRLPDYLFAVTPWLVHGAGQLHFSENAWFYSKLTGTKHETVEAVRALPPFVRRFSWEQPPSP